MTGAYVMRDGRKRWKEWLVVGPRVELVRGVHYGCSQSAMAQQIRNAARRLGVYVSLRDLDDRFVVYVRETEANGEGG